MPPATVEIIVVDLLQLIPEFRFVAFQTSGIGLLDERSCPTRSPECFSLGTEKDSSDWPTVCAIDQSQPPHCLAFPVLYIAQIHR